MDGVHVLNGDVQVVFVKSGFISEGFRPGFDGNDGALNELRAWRNKECALRDQIVYAAQTYGAQKKMSKSFLLVRKKSNGKE